jgi:hypothetical protein
MLKHSVVLTNEIKQIPLDVAIFRVISLCVDGFIVNTDNIQSNTTHSMIVLSCISYNVQRHVSALVMSHLSVDYFPHYGKIYN